MTQGFLYIVWQTVKVMVIMQYRVVSKNRVECLLYFTVRVCQGYGNRARFVLRNSWAFITKINFATDKLLFRNVNWFSTPRRKVRHWSPCVTFLDDNHKRSTASGYKTDEITRQTSMLITFHFNNLPFWSTLFPCSLLMATCLTTILLESDQIPNSQIGRQ